MRAKARVMLGSANMATGTGRKNSKAADQDNLFLVRLRLIHLNSFLATHKIDQPGCRTRLTIQSFVLRDSPSQSKRSVL